MFPENLNPNSHKKKKDKNNKKNHHKLIKKKERGQLANQRKIRNLLRKIQRFKLPRLKPTMKILVPG